MSGTYSGSYGSVITLTSAHTNVTVGPAGVINAYGLGGTYAVQGSGGTITLAPVYGAMFGPRGTVFTITNQGQILTHGTNAANVLDVGIGLGTPGTVLNAGIIEGASGVGILDATTTGLAGYVENSGLIFGSVGAGVYMSSGSVLNSGELGGAQGGVQIRGAGVVTNTSTGTIAATGTTGVAVVIGGSGLADNAGILFAQYAGVVLYSAGSVQNSGTIAQIGTAATLGAYAAGVVLQQGGTVTNLTGGIIAGTRGITDLGISGYVLNGGGINGAQASGVYFLTTGTAVNHGSIAGAHHAILERNIANTGAGTVSNTGLLDDVQNSWVSNGSLQIGSGVAMFGASLLTNASTGAIFGGDGVYINGGGGAVSVNNAGLVEGLYKDGIVLHGAGSIVNSGVVVAAGTQAVDAGISFAAGGALNNTGTVAQTGGTGVILAQGGAVTNHGIISGQDMGLLSSNLAATITNYGLIQATGTAAFSDFGSLNTATGLQLRNSGGTVVNAASGQIVGADALYVNGNAGSNASVENSGLIDGTATFGAQLFGNGATVLLDNLGVITGVSAAVDLETGAGFTNESTGIVTAAGAGVLSNFAGTTFFNAGQITGGADGIDLAAGGTVVNQGLIGGGTEAIYFGTGASRLVIEQGSTLIGAVTAAAGAALELSTAATAALFNMGGTINGFGGITFDAGDDWTLEGSLSELGSSVTSIMGFAGGDTIILNGFTAATASFNTSLDELDMRDAGGTLAQLHIVGPYTAGEFQVAVGLPGTRITLCFGRGTRILTMAGERAVEDLRPGDDVVTWRSGIVPLKWIGYQSFAGAFLARNPERLPVRIKPGALADGVPRRELTVSPGHAMLLGKTLVLAKDLVNGVTIVQDETPELVEYFALELDAHDCVVAEGALSESYADGPGLRNQFHNAAEFYAQFPDYAEPESLSLCAPRPLAGAALQAALMPIIARASAQAKPGTLRGFVDIIDAQGHIEGWAHDPANPGLPVLLDIKNGGTTIGQTLAFAYREDLHAAGIGKGRAKFTFDAPPGAHITVHHATTGTMLPLTDDCRRRMAG